MAALRYFLRAARVVALTHPEGFLTSFASPQAFTVIGMTGNIYFSPMFGVIGDCFTAQIPHSALGLVPEHHEWGRIALHTG
jgi:hypothetical protein